MTTPSGYKIPETIDPEELVCFKVYIPDDPLYRAAFWQSFRHLTLWQAWEKDPDKKAKDVAAVWKPAYDLSRTAYEAGEDCGLPEGVTLRVNNCTLEFFDPCTETWKPVNAGGASEDYDPLHDDPTPIPYPEPDPDPTSGTACIAAANAALGLKEIIDRLDYAYQTGGLIAWLEINLVLWGLKLVKWITALINSMTSTVASYTAEEFHTDYLAFDWELLKNVLHCYYDDEGVMSQAQHSALLAHIADTYAGTNLVWTFLELIIRFVGSVGMTNGAGHQYVTSAECDSCSGWCHVYDFTDGDLGTIDVENGVLAGALGMHWVDQGEHGGGQLQLILGGDTGYEQLYNITSVTVHANRDSECDTYGIRIHLQGFGGWGHDVVTHISGYDAPAVWAWGGSAAAARFVVYLWPYNGNHCNNMYITRLEICGEGEEPPY